ncbi:MAG TPA: RNA polymerase sigma factor [Gemmatimonadales bacterium]|nr:RNA polymerase sigma factor [Gemmatimonadales bacterium]
MAHTATDALFAEHAPALRNFLGARCRDPELAADLLQETAARLLAARPTLNGNGNPRGYLFRVAANVWRDHLRREIVRRRAATELAREDRRDPPAADERLLARDLQAAVRRAVVELPSAERDVLELRHREGLPFREIAEQLDRPLGTVLTQMHAALRRIGATLEDYR